MPPGDQEMREMARDIAVLQREQGIQHERINGLEQRVALKEDLTREIKPLSDAMIKFQEAMTHQIEKTEDMNDTIKGLLGAFENKIQKDTEAGNWKEVGKNMTLICGIIVGFFVLFGHLSGLLHLTVGLPK